MDLISIIIPVYNVDLYLDSCIESVVKQTYGAIQIILIDDGSTDNCSEICDKWATLDNRIEILHKKNGGLSDARNTGVLKAKGEFITFIDSDDIVEPTFIEYLYRAITQTRADISQCSYNRFCDSIPYLDQRTEMTEPTLQTSEQALYILSNYRHQDRLNCTVWNKMYRKK